MITLFNLGMNTANTRRAPGPNAGTVYAGAEPAQPLGKHQGRDGGTAATRRAFSGILRVLELVP